MTENNAVKVFEKAEFGSVRIIMKEGEPWFVAKDVLRALGYSEDYNPSRALQAVPKEWKGVYQMHTLGGEQEMLMLSESGLYFFLGRSDKSAAIPYQKWVAGDVIPNIRRHGLYVQDNILDRILGDPDFGIRLLQNYKEERQQRILAEQQRDRAIRTKAEIGNRREATAMNTASRLSKENAKLRDAMGEGKTWKTVRAIDWVTKYFEPSPGLWSQLGRRLGVLSAEMGYSVRKVPSSEFPGGVGVYHADVVQRLRARLDAFPDMLGKYRIRKEVI